MQARDVHAQVETLLGEPVRWASVKATLAGNLKGPAPRFVRVARGRYGVPPPPSPHSTDAQPTTCPRGWQGPPAASSARKGGRNRGMDAV